MLDGSDLFPLKKGGLRGLFSLGVFVVKKI